MSTTSPLNVTIRAFAEEVLFLGRSLTAAEEIQWTAAPIPKPREDTTERSKGGPPADTTLATVLDDRRLAVRDAVVTAHESLADAVERARVARRGLDLAIDAWNGN